MDGIFKDLKDFCLVYIDDDNGIILSPNKIELEKSEIDYLEIILSSTGIILQPHITTKIKEFPEKLETLKELQSLLGLLNYGRQFVKNLSKWEKPFLEKLKNTQKNQKNSNTKIDWSEVDTKRL
ncbi:DNA-directed DNA polymerase [Handroanthus impetiginosus]|uniref:DNA-directed DNA polymerase n=1 Tax=Handroanthus impetiginosus TaxID=429701 RepID=A0A2G9GTN3_9LAMI|nr:DNA-directed DNA polymerase [Handroanthus impetiginosus]